VIKSRTITWDGHVARIRERERERDSERRRGTYGVLVGNPERNKSLGRPRRRRDDNIKMDVKANHKMLRN
jgi:hypothetical protein